MTPQPSVPARRPDQPLEPERRGTPVGRCPRCGGTGGAHGSVHRRHDTGGGGVNLPCPIGDVPIGDDLVIEAIIDAKRCKCGHEPTDHGFSSTDRFRCNRPGCGCRTYRPKTPEETR